MSLSRFQHVMRCVRGALLAGAWWASIASPSAFAVDISDTGPVAIDQPRVYLLFQPGATALPYTSEMTLGFETFNIEAFLDTGTSGLLLSQSTATLLGIPTTAGTVFSDVGVGGLSNFDVSLQVHARIAPVTAIDTDNPATFMSVYNQGYGPIRAQIGPVPAPVDDLLGSLDIVGMPAMVGKVTVMNPRPVHDLELMHAFIYNPGTPFNRAAEFVDPGIPTTSHHVRLSYGDFDRFTQVTPSNGAIPTLNHNPFIGPNPVARLDANPPVDTTPPVSIHFQDRSASGSFLLDTGAAVSFISTDLAASLGVRYVDGTYGNNPRLERINPANPAGPGLDLTEQFKYTVGGIGDALEVAGFYLDDLIVHTLEGGAADLDPNHFRWLHTPVLIKDIIVVDPSNDQALVLDGVFGVNNWVTSVFLHPDGTFDGGVASPFNWVVFDEPNGILGLDFAGQIPEPGTWVLALVALAGLAAAGLKRRHR